MFSVTIWTLVAVVSPSAEMQSVYPTAPGDRAKFEEYSPDLIIKVQRLDMTEMEGCKSRDYIVLWLQIPQPKGSFP